nr:unnamed protein product [Callosobruchus chinensis]
MYKLYSAKCQQDNIPNKHIGKIWIYKKIFNTQFNFSQSSFILFACEWFQHTHINKFIETVLNKKRAVVSGIVTLDQRAITVITKKTRHIEVENARRHLFSVRTYESYYTTGA